MANVPLPRYAEIPPQEEEVVEVSRKSEPPPPHYHLLPFPNAFGTPGHCCSAALTLQFPVCVPLPLNAGKRGGKVLKKKATKKAKVSALTSTVKSRQPGPPWWWWYVVVCGDGGMCCWGVSRV